MQPLVKRVERPRELKWFQAGAMLYGDWGTSKAYVLGIAFALAGHGSWFFLGLMSCLTVLVGICYTVICRVYPDGGGVYSSLRNRSRPLAVIGALLLIADYVVTASLSSLSAFHYFNVPHPELWAMGTIFLIGAINWIGPSKSGTIATFVALFASAAAGVLFLSTLPHLPHVQLHWPPGGFVNNWSVFVGIVLALSGVEAVANMTGIMVEPVERTAKIAIWPVLLEVSVLTFLLGIAMNAVPNLERHTDDMLRALGAYYIGPWYGELVSVVFAFLLLSAVNTALNDLVSIQFAMGKDHELPHFFTRLNRFGMPSIALTVAVAVPVAVLSLVHGLVQLAALYAIGVVGAITINLSACALNRNVDLSRAERLLLYLASFILLFVEITIAFQKRQALLFALSVVGTGLLLRQLAKAIAPVYAPEAVPSIHVLTLSEAKDLDALYKSSFLVALRHLNLNVLDEMAELVKARGERSVYMYVVEEAPPSRELPIEMEPSQESLALLSQVEHEMEKRNVTAIPVWQMGHGAGKLIAHAVQMLGVRTVMIGATRRAALINILRGDVVRILARSLPKDVRLLIMG